MEGAPKNNKHKDGSYMFTKDDVNNLITKDFKSEKELKNYIVSNIKLFCKQNFNDEYISHIEEYRLTNEFSYNTSKRIDLFIKCKKGQYAIEIKNPIYKSEMAYSIGQLLTYYLMFEKKGIKLDKLLLLTTQFDYETAKIIDRFNLPIGLMLFSKKYSLIYIN